MNMIVTLKTITPLHIGTGQSVGATDLPIARERTTCWPVVPGSSVKGVLKDGARAETIERRNRDWNRSTRVTEEGLEVPESGKGISVGEWADKQIQHLFGSPTNDSPSAGALSITDLRCLLFPVRSLAGTFAYATCELALRRANELLAEPLPVLKAEPNQIVVDGKVLVHDGNVYLEDLDLKAEQSDLASLADAIAAISPIEPAALRARLAVLPDDLFRFLCINATEVTTHVSLEFETRTARGGFLRSEERVPSEALFIGLAVIDRLHGRHEEAPKTLERIASVPLQFGGKASTGSGLCKVKVSA